MALLLAKAKRVVIVASGTVLDVPFAALLGKNGKRLIERLAVSSSFSLSSLLWKDERKPVPGKLFAVTDTDSNQAVMSGKAVQFASLRGKRGALPMARQETGEVLKMFSPPFALAGGKGREAAVKAQMPKYGLLHFAVHGGG